MRGQNEGQQAVFTLLTPDQAVPLDHPARRIKALADEQLKELSPLFDEMYSKFGRPSIPPETLLKSCILMVLYSVRSERQFCEQLRYNLLFRWFLDQTLNDKPFDPSSFAKNKERMLESEIAREFFDKVVARAQKEDLLSAEHFTVDGSLVEAWASMKSFRPKDEKKKDQGPTGGGGNPSVDFHGQKRSNQTHQSTTDPQARLCKKGPGKEAKLAYSANVLMENRNGLCMDIRVEEADGFAERRAALEMVARKGQEGCGIRTLGADKGYDEKIFTMLLRCGGITPHIAAKTRSSLDRRTTRHRSYALSQRCRKKVEEIFGWMKTVGVFRKTRYRGVQRTGLWAYFVGTAYNLLRLAKLKPA